jgi:hypothetical protein
MEKVIVRRVLPERESQKLLQEWGRERKCSVVIRVCILFMKKKSRAHADKQDQRAEMRVRGWNEDAALPLLFSPTITYSKKKEIVKERGSGKSGCRCYLRQHSGKMLNMCAGIETHAAVSRNFSSKPHARRCSD